MLFSKKYYLLLLPILLLAATQSFKVEKEAFPQKKFNPNAGLVPSLTNHASIVASSNQADVSKILDGDISTAWQSGAPLPEGFIKNKHQNALLGKMPSIPSGYIKKAIRFTDADLNTSGVVEKQGGQAKVIFPFYKNNLSSVSLKCQTPSQVIVLAELASGGIREVGKYFSKSNFQLLRFEKPLQKIKALHLTSNDRFELFEIAVLESPPKESIVFQWDTPQKIGTVKAKCWAGADMASATHIYLSQNGKNWEQVAEASPEATHELLIGFPEQTASFLKLEHILLPKDWNKAFFWEVKIYDKNGHFGEMPVANPAAVSIGEMLGVNGYWSWGTDKCSYMLGENEGPRRFKNLASHARNYHDLTWDINAPDEPIDFGEMKEKGTPAKDWVNWDLEYQNWREAGLDVQASFQFYRFKPDDWKTPEKSAYQYANAFVKHFGPKNGNGLICSVEAGNEPWEYPADIYQKILKGMTEGAKTADPYMEVFPCALQAADPEMEKTDIFKNYIGARVNEEMAAKLDGVNTHVYSYVTGSNGKRRAVHPEHPLSSFWEINNLVRWRDHNMPGKKMYLSEWGWDCGGGGEVCTHAECVSERAAAAYAVRGLLIAARLGMERATWYFYANEKVPSSLYARSGLVSSVKAGFQKKMPFNSLQALVTSAGGSYFQNVIREDETAWLYLMVDKMGKPTHLIGWLPIEGDSQQEEKVFWKTGLEIEKAWVLDGKGERGGGVRFSKKPDEGYELELSAMPVVFLLK